MLFVSGSFLLPLLVECVASPSVRDVVNRKDVFQEGQAKKKKKKAVQSFLPQKKAEQPPTEREGFLSVHE